RSGLLLEKEVRVGARPAEVNGGIKREGLQAGDRELFDERRLAHPPGAEHGHHRKMGKEIQDFLLHPA
ncbi:MAG: hypothetical protein NTY23_13920, partial [Chloroflexi bacterium]|nr:hypothetical protein [Chloroflexota bacterium]